MLRSCLAISRGIKTTICKINNFSVVTSICPKQHLHHEVVPKTVVETICFSELKIEKVKLFTQSSTKIFRISVFNVGSCLASCLTFRPFLTLDPQQLGCLLKERVCNDKKSGCWLFFKKRPINHNPKVTLDLPNTKHANLPGFLGILDWSKARVFLMY